MDIEAFRHFGHRIVDWVADYRAKVGRGELPIAPRVVPGDVKGKLPAVPPEAPEPLDNVLHDLTEIVLPACMHSQDARFFGHFPSVSSLSGVIGEYVNLGLAQLGVSWQTSPALTELEEVVVDWLRQMLGLSAAWSGATQDTATTGILLAMLCARDRATGLAPDSDFQDSDKRLVAYASAHCHESVDKAARLVGIGRKGLRVVPVDEAFALSPDALEEMIAFDVDRGLRPCAVVATIGTANTTALDPLAEICRVARSWNLWVHVDAAMAGAAMILPECRWMWEGIEDADSMSFNPHKWLGAPFDCSTYFTRHPQHLVNVMGSDSRHLGHAVPQPKSFRDWGIQTTRQHRALKLWFLIREQGVVGLQARIRRDLAHARWLAAQIDAAPDWRQLAPCPLQTVCARHEPPGLTGHALDAHTLAWIRRINISGSAYLTPVRLQGRWAARVAFGGEATERHHVAALWEAMRIEAGARQPAGQSARRRPPQDERSREQLARPEAT
ncbi:MAG TPA: pyridoxal-dependent decarboxylase [Candidatus Limnocylindria bacterium]